MTTYIFDNTLDGLLTAVFDSFALNKESPIIDPIHESTPRTSSFQVQVDQM